ncbi:zinc-finger domain of monoamine-oxidase A repressor R1 [Tanacetum coccineum]
MKKNNKKKTMSENEMKRTEMESDNPTSNNGVPCHQVEYASCKNQTKTKPCLLKYCGPCLLNRYGEKAEDVTLLDQWDCPRCRGVCNCSTCMKKQGHQPTSIVKAMAGGFTSVSDMIHVKGAENVFNNKRVRETRASTRKQVASTEGKLDYLTQEVVGKENRLDGMTDLMLLLHSSSSPVKENHEKESVKESNLLDKLTLGWVDPRQERCCNALQLLEFCYTFGKRGLGGSDDQGNSGSRFKRLDKKGQVHAVGNLLHLDITSYTVAVGVIQNISESESDLEIITEFNDEDSWLKVQKSLHLSKIRMKHLEDCYRHNAAGYDKLDSSTKLGLLIFLCDEVLGTEKLRNWIDEENVKFGEKKKEAKGAAKLKEHVKIVSRIKNKEAEAHAEMLECKTMGLEVEKEKLMCCANLSQFSRQKGQNVLELKWCSENNPGILLQGEEV